MSLPVVISRSLSRFAIVLLALAIAPPAGTEPQPGLNREQEAFRARVEISVVPSSRGTGNLGTGAIQYDPGVPADSFPPGGVSFVFWGNSFFSASGLPLSSGTVSQISIYIGQARSANAFKVVAPGATIGGAPGFLSPASYAFNVVGVRTSSRTVGTRFLAGFAVGPAFDQLGMRSATTNGQGFHAIQRGFTPASTTTLPGQNAMIRVSGNVIIPVELVEFELE